MRVYFAMVLAPFLAWISWGTAVRLYPEHALDWFPFFWTLSDIAIFIAILGALMWIWEVRFTPLSIRRAVLPPPPTKRTH